MNGITSMTKMSNSDKLVIAETWNSLFLLSMITNVRFIYLANIHKKTHPDENICVDGLTLNMVIVANYPTR